MILTLLLLAPFFFALLLALLPPRFRGLARSLSLSLSASLLALSLGVLSSPAILSSPSLAWFTLPGTTAVVHWGLQADRMSALMLTLTSLLTLCALWTSKPEAGRRFFLFATLIFLLQGALFGCFLVNDAVVFFLCFEALVPPATLLIALFGNAGRIRAATLFAVFTLLGSAPMALALWGLASWTGSTSVTELLHTLSRLSPLQADLLFWGFAIAFAVKTPLFPLHGWQAESYAEAPAGVSALLSGAMAKVGLYGFLRWTIPLFSDSAFRYSQVFVLLGIATMLYGALLALRAQDIKRVLAFSSLSHLGLGVAGCFTLFPSATSGVVVLMFAHGLSAGALFLLSALPERWSQSRSLTSFGGLAGKSPRFAVLFLAACLASTAIPGTLGFVAEILILQGIWQGFGPGIALLAASSAILSAAYTLRLAQALLFGPSTENSASSEIRRGELLAIAPLILALFLLGFLPSPLL